LQTSRKHPIELRERAVRRIPKPVIAQLARQLNVRPEAGKPGEVHTALSR